MSVVEKRIEKQMLEALSLEEKLRLLNGVGSWEMDTCNGKLPHFFMSDGPHGLRRQDAENYSDINASRVATAFPSAATVACSWDKSVAEALAKALSEEAKCEDVDMVLGPGTNIKRSPLCGRNFEYFSEDPLLAGEMAAAYVKAMEDSGVACCLKHFAANNQETNRMTGNSVVDERTLREIYLAPFEKAVKEGHPTGIMSAYNLLNGAHASANRELLTDILRDAWGYEGAVISDWGAAIDIVACVKAGMDLEMPDSFGFHREVLKKAVEEGCLTEAEIDRAAENLIRLALQAERRRKENDKKDKAAGISRKAPDFLPELHKKNHLVALDIACQSAVLLQRNGVLPIKAEEKVLIIGDLAVNMRFQGAGSSHITTIPTTNAYEALKSLGCDVTFVRGYDSTEREEAGYSAKEREKRNKEAEALLTEALAALDGYDKILIFLGLTDDSESEGFDRTHLRLPANQLLLMDALLGKGDLRERSAVITFGGAPFLMPFADRVGDILAMYLGGQAVGEACAKLLSGEVNPSGRLAETWPLREEDVPAKTFGRKDANICYTENLYVGYRYYASAQIPVAFPFGHGLSYTDFRYDFYTISHNADGSVTAEWEMKNTGTRAGAEVSQLYIRPIDPLVGRPVLTLGGFCKTYLHPGEMRRVSITVPESAFSVYDVDRDSFITYSGKYELLVGSSSEDIRQTGQIELGYSVQLSDDSRKRCGEAAVIHRDVMQYYPKPKNENLVLSMEQFAKLFPEEMPLVPEVRERYEIADSMEVVCDGSVFGRCFIGILKALLPLGMKGGKNNPTYKMVVVSMLESPVEALPALSGRLLRPGFMQFLVDMANRERRFHRG